MGKVVEKGRVRKEIESTTLLADYVLAGWKIVDKKESTRKDNIETENIVK